MKNLREKEARFTSIQNQAWLRFTETPGNIPSPWPLVAFWAPLVESPEISDSSDGSIEARRYSLKAILKTVKAPSTVFTHRARLREGKKKKSQAMHSSLLFRHYSLCSSLLISKCEISQGMGVSSDSSG